MGSAEGFRFPFAQAGGSRLASAKLEVFKVGKLYHLYFFIRYWWLRRKYTRRIEQMRRLG